MKLRFRLDAARRRWLVTDGDRVVRVMRVIEGGDFDSDNALRDLDEVAEQFESAATKYAAARSEAGQDPEAIDKARDAFNAEIQRLEGAAKTRQEQLEKVLATEASAAALSGNETDLTADQWVRDSIADEGLTPLQVAQRAVDAEDLAGARALIRYVRRSGLADTKMTRSVSAGTEPKSMLDAIVDRVSPLLPDAERKIVEKQRRAKETAARVKKARDAAALKAGATVGPTAADAIGSRYADA